jgi:hypothetical protein
MLAVNTTVIVALIAAGSGVAVAGVAFIGNAVTAWANARQAQAKIVADHAAWLRDRRAEVYVQANSFVRSAAWKRVEIIKDGEVSPACQSTAIQLLAYYKSPEIMKLSADGTTFVNHKLAFALEHALIANLQAWRLFLDSVEKVNPGGYITLTEDIRQALDEAQLADRKFYQLVKLDVQWTEYSGKHLRVRRRAERRQLREFRKLKEQKPYSSGPPPWRLLAPEDHHSINNGKTEAGNVIFGQNKSE